MKYKIGQKVMLKNGVVETIKEINSTTPYWEKYVSYNGTMFTDDAVNHSASILLNSNNHFKNEIKFKAWNFHTENMFQVARIDFADNSVYPRIFGPGQLLEDCVLLQYTGHEDDYGKEMYVGHIVKVKAGFVDSPSGYGYRYQMIDIIESLEYFHNQLLKEADYFEVIGDIYQDKDLANRRYESNNQV